MKKINNKIKQLHQQVLQQQKLSQNYNLAIQDERYKYINYLQQVKIQKDKQKSLKTDTTKIINKTKHRLRSFADNLIISTQQTLKQNTIANNRNLTAIRSANSRTLTRANRTAHTGILSRIRSTFNTFKSNYKSNSISKSLRNSKQSSYNSVINSIEEPVAIKRANWQDRINRLERQENLHGLYMNQHQELQSLQSNPPQTVNEYSNSIQSTQGLNLIQSSASSASSYAQILPSIRASKKSQSESLNDYQIKLYKKHKKEHQKADKAEIQKEKLDRQYRDKRYRKIKRWIKKHPKQAQEARNRDMDGPTL